MKVTIARVKLWLHCIVRFHRMASLKEQVQAEGKKAETTAYLIYCYDCRKIFFRKYF